jgi:hypothetical protein
MLDRPYIYVYNGDALADNATYLEVTVPTEGDSDFHLRRGAGINTVCRQFMARNAIRYQLFGRQINVGGPGDYPLVPELVYPAASFISMDLINTLRSNNPYPGVPGSIPNYWSQIAFQGVRRYQGGALPRTGYPYYERPYTLTTAIVVAWAGRAPAAFQQLTVGQTFVVPVQDYDFELFKMSFLIQVAQAPVPVPSVDKVKMTLYDVEGRQMMSAPVVDELLNDISVNYNSVYPVPPVLYPVGSQIKFDIWSLLIDTEIPATLEVNFHGKWRLPK